MTDAPSLPIPTTELVDRALDREHTYRQTQKLWAQIEASLRRTPLRYQEVPE